MIETNFYSLLEPASYLCLPSVQYTHLYAHVCVCVCVYAHVCVHIFVKITQLMLFPCSQSGFYW